jgi:Fe-S-cluster containining protein
MATDYRLCPCGSGLQFKACCGKKEQMEQRVISLNRATAYAGATGRRRESFCQQYTLHKEAAIAGMKNGLQQEAKATGIEIACARGCPWCCYVYVVASMQECEAIVYYLYQHEDALQHFLRTYRTWRTRVEKIRGTFFEISRLQQKRMAREDTPHDSDSFNSELIKYSEERLPCPFLNESSCSIYEIRPFVCAGLASTTCREWCDPAHPCHKHIRLLKAEVTMDEDMPYFANPQGKPALTNMPALVYEILRYGWEFLWKVPGLEYLKANITDDPEINEILRMSSST